MLKNTKFLPGPRFAKLLLQWNAGKNNRQMPWKGEKDPYRIWLSEVILQQTRVDQGMAYYYRFTEKYPRITDLAAAPDDEVMKLWEGLGYYSRCRNLMATARTVTSAFNGVFPGTYEEILALKGVGPYTAAAISSFGFGLPHAVVDGNVFRVLARVFGIDEPIDSSTGKNYFISLAQQLLDHTRPAAYNQAIMDFGAVVCKPALPLCHDCVFSRHCYAFQNNMTDLLPVKAGKTKIRKRWFYYFILESDQRIAIRKRSEKGIWQELYEFPMLETEGDMEISEVLIRAEEAGILQRNSYHTASVSALIKQQLSHQLILGRFIRIILDHQVFTEPVPGAQWVSRTELPAYAFPGIINHYLGNPAEQQMF